MLMMYLKYCLVAVAATSIAAAGSLASANLLVNPGFEDPVTSDGAPFVGFWEVFSLDGDQDTGNDIARNSTAMPRSGNQSLELAIEANTPDSFAGVFQDVDGLSEDQNMTFSGWHKSLLEPGGIEIRIEWRDSLNDVEISRTPNFTPTPGSEYELFSLTADVPAGADVGRVVYAIQSFGAPPGQQVFVDDTSAITGGGPLLGDVNRDGEVNGLDVDPFVAAVVGGGVQAVPEPTALILVVIALGVVGGWRKWGG
jgi:hypothetical protein